MVRTAFFADVLGFSSLSSTAPDMAVDALTDIATRNRPEETWDLRIKRHLVEAEG